MFIVSFFVYRDNLRRKQAEEDIDRFFTLSLDLLCISGMDGYFKRLSPSYVDVLGHSMRELLSRPIIDFIHPEDIEPTQKEIVRKSRGHKVLSFENRFRCKDGTYKIFSWKSVPVGQFMYAVARDITLQKKFETDLTSAREVAQASTLAKSTFLANMSHEIRTPLNGVVGMTDLLARTKLSEDQEKFVSAIRSSSQHLLKIVNEVLDFSKFEVGRVHIDKLDFDISHLIEEQLSSVGVLAKDMGLEVEAQIDPKIPRILRGDSGKISQILLNFVSNSLKFTTNGKIVIGAQMVSLFDRECIVKLSVRDSGMGMTAAQKAVLFEPYVQADNSTARVFGRTGLGLSICKRFAEVMNGSIGVDSQPGQGSTFWIEIPLELSLLKSLAKTSHAETQTSVIVQRSDEKLLRRKSIRVLIAEDIRMNQIIIMEMMNMLGYTATIVENGKEAVKIYQENSYDLIFMDHHMPIMDGVEACLEIRKIEKASGRYTPIIAFTATILQGDQKDGFKDLIDDFILKPVSIDSLQTLLNHWEKIALDKRAALSH